MIDTDDRYFEVEMSADRSDGNDEYIISELIRNFSQMFPKSYRASAWIYGIKFNEFKDGVPELHGLIRYDNMCPYKIVVSSTHIQNKIVGQFRKTRVDRPFTFKRITITTGRQHNTRIDDITRIYNTILTHCKCEGSELKYFL